MGRRDVALFRNDGNAAAARIVTDDLVVVVPEDVRWRFRAVLDGAGQVDGAALVHVQVGPTDDGRRGY